MDARPEIHVALAHLRGQIGVTVDQRLDGLRHGLFRAASLGEQPLLEIGQFLVVMGMHDAMRDQPNRPVT